VKECVAEDGSLRDCLLRHACERLEVDRIHYASTRGMICTTQPAGDAEERARLTRRLLCGAQLYMSLMMD
jgi:hypothetical protein